MVAREWVCRCRDHAGRERELAVAVDDERRWRLRTPPGEVATGDPQQLKSLIVTLTQVLRQIG